MKHIPDCYSENTNRTRLHEAGRESAGMGPGWDRGMTDVKKFGSPTATASQVKIRWAWWAWPLDLGRP